MSAVETFLFPGPENLSLRRFYLNSGLDFIYWTFSKNGSELSQQFDTKCASSSPTRTCILIQAVCNLQSWSWQCFLFSTPYALCKEDNDLVSWVKRDNGWLRGPRNDLDPQVLPSAIYWSSDERERLFWGHFIMKHTLIYNEYIPMYSLLLVTMCQPVWRSSQCDSPFYVKFDPC